MAEKDQRQRFVRETRSELGSFPVENLVGVGTPDVAYHQGWVELKWLREWPKREDSVVRLDHWTRKQQLWHYAWRKGGGTSWVLVQCRHEWLLLDGAVASLWLGKLSRQDLIARCHGYWDGVVWREMIGFLRKPQAAFCFTREDLEQLAK